MWHSLAKKLLGTQSQRDMKHYARVVEAVNAWEPEISKLSDEALAAKTVEFRARLEQGETTKDLQAEAFAVVREVSKRVNGERHYDVQIIGGSVLFDGKIAEMATGEGKTLVATLPVYLEALTGKGVHVVTVNDYLAQRDRDWMGPIFEFLGLTVGVIKHGVEPAQRRENYHCDITYGTNNEFGFDYLRDHMSPHPDYCVQRPLNFAVVDEVDSILIDEARTPLIISGPGEESTDKYHIADGVVRRLVKDNHFKVDERDNAVHLTEDGNEFVKNSLGMNIYEESNIDMIHHINQALRAHNLFRRDGQYVVESGEVIIVDEFTGRLMPGRRYSDGLHQALEAKEGLKIQQENQTLATITFQNYFRLYKKLAGMTGTADTEAGEFLEIYKLYVVVIPTNRPLHRTNFSDVVYLTERDKFRAVVDEIAEMHESGRPVLVGTVTIDKSEALADMLKRRGVKHNVLNAKNHAFEAEIVANAGQDSAVTIATNMAGRGTDIKLGAGVADKGGLHIIGTERHESRRIDNQLRGRTGRQGDPGSSRFHVALEDDVIRVFGGEKMKTWAERFGMKEGEVIESRLVSRSIEKAQKNVEEHHFEMRKNILKYDDVMNRQREVVYRLRDELMHQGDYASEFEKMVDDVVGYISDNHASTKQASEDWDWDGIRQSLLSYFNDTDPVDESIESLDAFETMLRGREMDRYHARLEHFGEALGREILRDLMLSNMDAKWREHLRSMDHLKDGVGLRGYGQKDPLIEYSTDGYEMFQEMFWNLERDVVSYFFRVEVISEEERQKRIAMRQAMRRRTTERKPLPGALAGGDGKGGGVEKLKALAKVGRNDLCPCGSGKKYKSCCMH